MPQMSPLSWWILFMFFISMLVMICVMNYFILINKPTQMEPLDFNKKIMNWKW
uniref:ATP synthase F0 subunit 8 n=1 Tax=Chasmoptera huttii TaxID=1265314 RepID=A0A1S5QY04_9NEOP|nr:ATP synthase F0 subunit 8 [Chasmoptera huttii]